MKKTVRAARIVSAALLLLCMVFSMCACSVIKTPNDGDFMLACQEQGLTAVGQDAASTGMENMTKLYIADGDEDDIEFIQFSDSDSAKSLYSTIKEAIKNDNAEELKEIDTAGYNKYYITVGDTYEAVIRVENVIIYGKETTSSGKVRAIFKYLDL